MVQRKIRANDIALLISFHDPERRRLKVARVLAVLSFFSSSFSCNRTASAPRSPPFLVTGVVNRVELTLELRNFVGSLLELAVTAAPRLGRRVCDFFFFVELYLISCRPSFARHLSLFAWRKGRKL